MSRRNLYILAVLSACALAVSGLAFGAQPATQAQAPMAIPMAATGPRGPLPDALRNMPEEMKVNHARYDNLLTALYERWLAGEDISGATGSSASSRSRASGPFAPLFGADVRMSNPAFAGTQNEFQLDINPNDSRFIIGTSNDGRTAGVGIYRSTDSGATWTAQDAPIGVAACCDPAVAYSFDGVVYVGVLSTSAGEHVIKSTDNGATWSPRVTVPMPDRNNLVVDNGPSSPRRGAVYTTYSDLPATNRIKGYRSTDGGATWGTSFFVGAVAPPQGYEQSSQPQVASDGTLYVGYQQYTNSGIGCSAGVQNVLARSTDGGATFAWTVLPIVQGGACSSAQAGRGIFCINAGGSSFRSRSHPIIGVNPTNPQHVYMVYSGGDLETPYTCGASPGFHSDTLFRKSTDGGVTFTTPIRINADPLGKDQYYPWIDVAANGQIWVGWNDRREDANNFRSKWYQAYSNDEGETWTESVVADVETQPSTFIGDYHGLAAVNDLVLGMWYDSRNTASGDPYTDPNVPPAQGTPTPTFTGTPPTFTPTRTRTNTSTVTLTPTCAPGLGNYRVITGTNTLVPGTVDTGNHTDDGTTLISLPFSYTLYNQSFSTVNVSSNGRLDFVTVNDPGVGGYSNVCLPAPPNLGPFDYTIFPHWDDQRTDQIGSCTSFPGGCGIFTSVSGSAPNRIFNIEWRVVYFGATTQTANYEVRLYEGQTRFDVIFGAVGQTGTSATVGVQGPTSRNLFTQYECNTGGLTNGLQVTFDLPPCGTPTPTFTGTPPTFTRTATFTNTVTRSPTACAVRDYVSTDVPKDICDLCTVTSTLQVPDAGTIADVDVRNLNISHTYIDDLIITLTAPDGTVATIWNRDCGSDNDIPGVNFDDEAAGVIACPPVAGATYRPSSPLSALDGHPTNGRWVLTISDNVGQDFGTLNAWGLRITVAGGCVTGTPPTATPTPTNTSTSIRTNTPTITISPTTGRTNTPSNTPTRGSPTVTSTAGSPAATRTFTATSTPGSPVPTDTPCPMNFSDVSPTDYFYEPVRYLFCRGVISGYADRTFKPYNMTTRGQLAKIVVLAEGWPIYTPPTPTFRDVPTTDTFYAVIETAYNHGIISGYVCGANCLEYRPGNNITRAQLCKIVVLAENWEITPPTVPTFRDVPKGDPFYGFIETAYAHGIISGYTCGPACLEFRPGNNATRGQIAKIVYLAVTAPLKGKE